MSLAYGWVSASTTQNGGAGNNDGSITNTARLNMSGRSEIAPGIAAFGFAEWNVADGDSNEAMSNDETMSSRDQYIGVDFGKFGSVLVGRTFDSLQKVIEVTDIYEDMGGNAPPICTSFSIAGIPLDVPVLAEAVITLGDVPIAPYAELGTKEVAEVIAPYCHTHNGVLLANHGAVTWAEDAYAAYYRLESMEYYANILMITGKILGKQNCFTKEQVDRLIAMREKFGISRGGVPRTEKED